MIKLNLKAETAELQTIKEFLEENVNETLADKINNGTPFEKDGKSLINKKTLTGFMKYACDEARKLADKNATSACVDDATVYGWAIHYFEEESIEGTLYTIDGAEYKLTPKKASKPVQRVPAPVIQANHTPPKPTQFNLFDMVTQTQAPKNEDVAKEEIEEPVEEIQDNIEQIAKLNVDMETGEILRTEPILKEKETIPLRQASPLYQKYMRFQNEYPHAVIAYRLGDFFEVFGDNAVKLANRFDLTLTGRDCGLSERVPMIGFPFHAAEMYFQKIANSRELIVIDGDTVTPYTAKENEDTAYNDSLVEEEEESDDTMYETNDENDIFEENLSVQRFFEKNALFTLYELFDYELDMQ